MTYTIAVTGYTPCTLTILTAADQAVRGDGAVALLTVAGRTDVETHRIIPLTSTDDATIRKAMSALSEPVTD